MFRENYDTLEEAVEAILSTADDIDSATVFLSGMFIDMEGELVPEVGMVLEYCDAQFGFLSRPVAATLLSQGILQRMRIPLEFV